jgi:hypothetical protein
MTHAGIAGRIDRRKIERRAPPPAGGRKIPRTFAGEHARGASESTPV